MSTAGILFYISKHKSWHDDGKFDARLTARAIDHSHVDQTSLRTIDEQSRRRIVANRLSRYAGVRSHREPRGRERGGELILMLISQNNLVAAGGRREEKYILPAFIIITTYHYHYLRHYSRDGARVLLTAAIIILIVSGHRPLTPPRPIIVTRGVLPVVAGIAKQSPPPSSSLSAFGYR